MNAETKIEQQVTFTLPSRFVEAARVCAAKADIRYYLNGIRINATRISATDGHTLYDHKFDKPLDIPSEYIVSIKQPVPAAARSTRISILGAVATVSHFTTDKDLLPIKTEVVAVVDGKFPDVDKVMPDLQAMPEQAVGIVGLNATYVAKAAQVGVLVAENRNPCMKLRVTAADKPAWCEFQSPDGGKHIFVLMPMRI